MFVPRLVPGFKPEGRAASVPFSDGLPIKKSFGMLMVSDSWFAKDEHLHLLDTQCYPPILQILAESGGFSNLHSRPNVKPATR